MSNAHDIIISSRIRLARNVAGVPFPNRMTGGEDFTRKLVDVNNEIVTAICGGCERYNMSALPELFRHSLVEMNYISPRHAGKMNDAAVCINFDNGLAVMINEEDHIRAQFIEQGYDIDRAFTTAQQYDKMLSSRVKIAFDKQHGYLTACPTNLGSAMRVGVMAFLPGLVMTRKIDAVLALLKEQSMEIRGIYGEGSNSESYRYQISLRGGLGKSNIEQVAIVKNAIDKLISAEQNARRRLIESQDVYLKDKIMRAYGKLVYAQILPQQEFNDALALVRLGVSLGYIKGNLAQIDQLHTDGQRNTLSIYMSRNAGDINGVEIARAKLINEKIKDITSM